MTTAVFQIEDLTCPSCAKSIEKALGREKGVDRVTVLFNAGKVRVSFDGVQSDAERFASVLHKLGYPVLSQSVS